MHPFQTSWGVTTRMIGGLIMTHGDNNGLVLPPAVAPIQVVIIPVQQQKEGVLDAAYALRDRLKGQFRVKVDDSDNSPGWKFSEYEMKGVPLRIEIGPRDIADNKCVTVQRHNREKNFDSLENIEQAVADRLAEVRKGMYEKALANRTAHTYACTSIEEIKDALAKNGEGFVKAMWCGDETCEDQVKESTGVASRCIPFEQEQLSDRCVCCGKPAKHMVYWATAY